MWLATRDTAEVEVGSNDQNSDGPKQQKQPDHEANPGKQKEPALTSKPEDLRQIENPGVRAGPLHF